MATLSTVNVKITGDTGQLVTSLTHAEGRVNSFAAKVTTLGNTTNTQARGFSNLARAFTNAAGQTGVLNSEISILASSVGNVGLAAAGSAIGVGVLVGGLTASIGAAISFETAITKVAKTANFSKEETAAFGDAILEMSKRLPVATSSLTNIAVVAGQLGIQGTANISRFVEEVAKLESTTGVSAEALATGLGTLVQVSGLPIDAIDNISASLTNLGNTSNSTEEQILNFATRLVGIGTALGVPLADILSISSSFAAAGVPVERGGTAIQNILIAIDSAAQKGGDELQLFADVAGQTAEEFKNLVETDPGIAFGKFVEGLKGVKNVIPVLEALEIADARIVASALSAANAQAGIIAPLEANRIAAANATATNDEFARSSETTAAKLQILKNNVNATAVELGTVLLPAVRLAIDGLNSMFEGAPGRIENFKENISGLVGVFGSVDDAVRDVADSISNLSFDDLPDDSRIDTLVLAFRGLESAIADIPIQNLLDKLNSIPGTGAIDALAGAFRGLADAVNFDIPSGGDIGRAIGRAAVSALPGGAALQLATHDFGGGGEPPLGGGGQDAFGFSIPQDLVDNIKAWNDAVEEGRTLAIPPGLQGGGGGGGRSGPEPLTIEKALSDHVISLVEALTLGLSDAEVVALELADARSQEGAAAFRTGIELNKLAAIFPGLNGEQIQFALALAAIEQNLRDTNRTAEQFKLEEAVGPELDRLQSRLQEVLGQPTRETLGLQRQRAVLEKRRLLLLQGGVTDDDSRVKAIDRELEGLNNLIRLREAEVDIMRIDAKLADQRTLTDQAQVTQTTLLTAATGLVSSEFNHLQGAAYLAAVALERIGGTPAAEPLSLRDALIAIGNLPDKGASLLPPELDQGGVITKSGLAEVDRGERLFNNGFGPRGESGITNFNETTQIYVTANTKNDAEEIARVVAERLTRQQRLSDRRGHFVTTGGGFP